MAQCQAVDCEIKNFEVCHSLQNITPPICRVIGSSESVNAQCVKKDVSTANTVRKAECTLTEQVITESGFRAQDVCENISGCEWTYSGDGTDLLKKECKSIDSTASYECANHESLSRYSTIESDTFGCDKINCEYVVKKYPKSWSM